MPLVCRYVSEPSTFEIIYFKTINNVGLTLEDGYTHSSGYDKDKYKKIHDYK